MAYSKTVMVSLRVIDVVALCMSKFTFAVNEWRCDDSKAVVHVLV